MSMTCRLQTTVSVFGRFHAFELAQQLQRAGALDRLITTYPRYFMTRRGLAPGRVSTLLPLELLARLWAAVPAALRGSLDARVWFCEHFDQAASRRLSRSSNLFVGWSSYSLRSIHRAQALGMRTVVERGSSHIGFQTEIMREEHERWGLRSRPTPPAICEREMQEYDDADRIAVPSLFARQTFLDRGVPPEKLFHLPYGVSLEEFFPMPKEDGVFRVIHCGAIGLRKGIPYLLQAFHELALPNAELWLVGHVEPEIRGILARYGNDRIVLKGRHPQGRLRWFYSQCSVFCLASIEEGFGLVVPQAMACGLPIIHTTNSGGRDIVEGGVEGFEVPIRDADALKDKILHLYRNPEVRHEMGRRARERSVAALSWRQYGDRVLAAYRSLLV